MIITLFLILVVTVLLVTSLLSNRGIATQKIKTIEECNKLLCNCHIPEEYIKILQKRANLYKEQEDYSLALEDYIKLMEYYVKSNYVVMIHNVFENIIKCYLKLEQYDQIVAFCTKIIQNNADFVDFKIYSERAMAYQEIGDRRNALADFSKVIEMITKEFEKDNTYWDDVKDAYINRSQCYSDLEMYNEALEDMQIAFKKYIEKFHPEYLNKSYNLNDLIEDDVIDIFAQTLDIQFKANKLEDALQTSDKLISLDTEDPLWVYHKAEILEKLERLEEAVKYYQQAKEAFEIDNFEDENEYIIKCNEKISELKP